MMHLKALWPWHWSTVRDTGATIYEVCPCGQRRIRQAKDGFQPIDRGWLETGEWTPRPARFPAATSGVSRGGGHDLHRYRYGKSKQNTTG